MFEPDRLPDWPDRLVSVVARHRDAAFAWGDFDCATLFAEAVHSVTGEDPFGGLGPWQSERDALRILAATGSDSVKGFFDARLPLVHRSELRRGDAGYAATAERLSCPVIVLGAEAVSRDHAGWVVLPVSLITTAYRIGR